jgi:hypothetical protein
MDPIIIAIENSGLVPLKNFAKKYAKTLVSSMLNKKAQIFTFQRAASITASYIGLITAYIDSTEVDVSPFICHLVNNSYF